MRPFGSRRHEFRVERGAVSPLQKGESRDRRAEQQLTQILKDQGVEIKEIVVVHRKVSDDPIARARAMRRSAMFKQDRHLHHGDVLVAGLNRGTDGEWLTTRVLVPPDRQQIIFSILGQTLLIYAVVMGAIAFILRRITRPLAALTGRFERFGERPNSDGQLTPQGPVDIRRLIIAHNAMEARISALLDEKDVMLGAIGHDLKTPLAALRVRIESVENDVERGRMAATIEDIVRSLDDILSLARVGRPSDPLERTELSALVASIIEEFEDMGDNVEPGTTERIVLPLRSTWLRRALRNLIGNGLRYGKCARVSVMREDDVAVILIDDDGPGIPEADIADMMEPFARGEPSRNSETGGTGLGLALARAIAEQHGGSLELTNRRQGGTGGVKGLRATLRLPLI